MAKKELILDGIHYELGADAENVDYTNASMEGVSNVDDALGFVQGEIDALDGRVQELESPSPTVVEYTGENCAIENNFVTSNANEQANTDYDCSRYLAIPAGTKMLLKVSYTIVNGILFFKKNKYSDENYTWMSGKNIVGVGPYDEYTEIAIPDNAVAIRFSHYKKSNNQISIKFVEKAVNKGVAKLKVGAWNMGHFSGGHENSAITNEDVDTKRVQYRKVFDSVNADILCLSEFDPVFNTDVQGSTPQSEILCNYPYYKIGAKSAYNCNAVFSKIPILQTQEFIYTVKGANRYIKETTLEINGKPVKVIATHLNEESNGENLGITQMQELISIYANDPYVIIGADFNLHISDKVGEYVSGLGGDGYLNYKYLTEAGYTLMNYDYLDIVNPWRYPDTAQDHPGELKGSTADNIAVKGFAMGKREYIYEENVSNTLSDHCMVACELVML